MSMYEKLDQKLSARDVNAYLDLVYEDAVFVFHK